MIELAVQIKSLVCSFLFGIFFFLMVRGSFKLLFHKNIYLKLFFNILFIVFNTLIYFSVLLLINEGVVHIYFLLSILGGYLLTKKLYNKMMERN